MSPGLTGLLAPRVSQAELQAVLRPGGDAFGRRWMHHAHGCAVTASVVVRRLRGWRDRYAARSWLAEISRLSCVASMGVRAARRRRGAGDAASIGVPSMVDGHRRRMFGEVEC